MKRINYLRVELKPSYNKDGSIEIRTEVQYRGNKISSIVHIYSDDFESNFDLYMNEAKHLILEELKK